MSRLRQLLSNFFKRNKPKILSIEEAIAVTRRGIRKADQEDWLFLPNEGGKLTPSTNIGLGRVEIDERGDDREIIPEIFSQHELHSTIDIDTFKACIDWGDKLSGHADTVSAIIVLDHYLRFDAWPEALDAPEPLSNEEFKKVQENKFYDLLGDENIERPCKQEGCDRGSVDVSVFCAAHHLKSIQKSYNPNRTK